MPTPQNGQTHSNTLSVFDHLVGLALKGLTSVKFPFTTQL